MSDLTIVEQTHIQVRLACIILDGEKELSRHWHRIAISPDSDFDRSLPFINSHLDQLGFEVLESAGVAHIKEITATIYTPKMIGGDQIGA